MTVKTGLERLALGEGPPLSGRKVGLLAHPPSVDRDLRHTVDIIAGSGATLVSLFGPEHGIGGEAQDMEHVEEGDQRAGPRIFSLYGEEIASLSPSPDMLDGIDLFIADLQDVGARYYTYVWTAALCLEACCREGIDFLLLDRPNPIGAHLFEGPGIEKGFESFVGHHDLCNRHGMTIGEILRLYARERELDAGLEVLAMSGYSRELPFESSGLPWVLPSPNMPTPDTALVYPGLCLIEGTNLSEGRGTTRPFELVGAPWLDGDTLAHRLDDEELPGCRFRPCRFKPTFQKHAGTSCGGIQLHIVDREAFRPVRTGVAVVAAAFALGGGDTAWRPEPYEFVTDRPAIDLLAGGSWLREGIEAHQSTDELCRWWSSDEGAFEERRARALLY